MTICDVNDRLFEFIVVYCDALRHVKDWDLNLGEVIKVGEGQLAIIVAYRQLCVKTGKSEDHCVGPLNLGHYSSHRLYIDVVLRFFGCCCKLFTIKCDLVHGLIRVTSIAVGSVDLVELAVSQLYILTIERF